MDPIGIIVSALSGGLAGGFVSSSFNRLFHRQDLRARFYSKLNDMYSAYLIRTEKPEGRYLARIVGNNPSVEDEEFVNHRSSFTSDLVQFSALKEARALRKQLLDNEMSGDHTPGLMTKLDLVPELKALEACLKTIHKKLKL
jgi:hypothetical protein